MQIPKTTLILLSAASGAILLALTKLFEVECRMAEPGGVNEGGAGFPFPYFSCGAWGESFSWAFVAVDFVILSLVSCVIIRLIVELRGKS